MIGPIIASGNAADAQEKAAQTASDTEMTMFNKEQENLQPYMQTGLGANTAINNLTGINGSDPLSSPLLQNPSMNLSESALSQTPGYQFNLSQGLKSVQNSAAARGLGTSGAALKGASTYATGLADSTYQNQFNNALTNQTNQFNRLVGLTQLGQNSAAGVGAAGIETGANIASNTIGAGNASAAASLAMGNSGSNALSSAYMANGLFSGSSGGAASAGGTAAETDGASSAAFEDLA